MEFKKLIGSLKSFILLLGVLNYSKISFAKAKIILCNFLYSSRKIIMFENVLINNKMILCNSNSRISVKLIRAL